MITDSQEGVVPVERNERSSGKTAGSSLAPSTDRDPIPFVRHFMENVERTFDEWQRWGWPVPPAVPLPRTFWSRDGAEWMPQIEVMEQDGNFVVRAELPGLRRDDISVEVSNGVLTLSGKREEKKEEKENGYYRSERSYGKFFQSIPLPEGATGEDAKAEFKDGLLEITMAAPVRKENRRKIDVA